MTKIGELHSKNDRIKEQLHALEVSKLFTKKDKLQLGNYYRKIIEKNSLKIDKLINKLEVTTNL